MHRLPLASVFVCVSTVDWYVKKTARFDQDLEYFFFYVFKNI